MYEQHVFSVVEVLG